MTMPRHVRLGALLLTVLALPAPAAALPNLEGCISVEVFPDGSDATYTTTLTNSGDQAASKTFYWSAWFTSQDQPTLQASWYGQVPAGLAVGQVYEASTTWSQRFPTTPLPVGTLRAWLQIDDMSSVFESDEDDNWCGPVPYQVGDPDRAELEIASFEVEVNEDVVTYRAVVANVGPVDAGPFNLDVFLDRDAAPTPGQFGDDVVVVPGGLPAGTSTPVEFPPLALANGAYCSWLLADTEGYVTEFDKANNVQGPRCFEVNATTSFDRPDLQIADFTTEAQGDQVLYTVWLKNAGTRSTEVPFWVGLFVDDVLQPQTGEEPDVTVLVTDDVPRGGTLPVYLFWGDLANGQFSSWAYVDVFSDVDEIIEKNNTAGPLAVTVALEGPDLAVEDFTWTWDPLGAVVYQVEVRNRGNAPSAAFDVDLAFDLAEAPTQASLEGDDVMSLRDEAGLGVDETRTYKLRWDEPRVGEHRSWVAVDLFRESGDLLLGNNVKGPLDVPVTAESLELPDVRVEALAVEASGAVLDLYVKVANAGPRATGPFRVALFLGREVAPSIGERGDLETTIPSLGPADATGSGDEVVWTPAYSVTEDTTFSVWVLADSDDEVLESDELNNLNGPQGALVEVAACALDQRLEAECLCGPDIARAGEFCCEGGVVSTLRCNDQVTEWEGAEGAPDADGSGSGGCAWAFPSVDASRRFAATPMAILLTLLALLTARRRKGLRVPLVAPETDRRKSREVIKTAGDVRREDRVRGSGLRVPIHRRFL